MANIGLRVRDENEQQVVDIMTKCHNWLATELDIESNMEFGRTCNWGKDAFHAGFWCDSTKQSVLNFRNLYGANMYQMLKIVAHEARHGVQHKCGMLTDENRGKKMKHDGRWESGTWNGEYWSGKYRDAPWEIDARAHEEPYAQMVIDAGIISQEELSIKLAGRDGDTDHMIIRLDTETQNEIKQKHGHVTLWKAAVQTKEEDDANTKLFQSIISKVFTFNTKSNMWNPMKGCGLSHKELDKVWKKAKGETKLKYRDDAIAFLTTKEMAKLKKEKASKTDMFWAAQKNMVVYKTRPATEDDLVY